MTVVVRMPGVDAPETVPFHLYTRSTKKRTSEVLQGDNGAVGYEGNQSAQKYCLAVKDRETGELRLIEVPVHEVTTFVKKQRENDLGNVIRQSGVKNWVQRNALGEAFGTKRAKTAISDVARNRLDADMLEDMEGAIVDTVQTATAHLPSQEERKKAVEAERPIPSPNVDTENPAEIYTLDAIVPARELESLAGIVDDLMSTNSQDSRAELLPFGDSDFINSRITQVIADKVHVKPRLKLLVYLSFVRAIYEARRVTSKDALVKRLKVPVPDNVIDGAIRRFTLPRPGQFGRSRDRSFAIDPFHLNKLLCYMLALILHIDEFTVAVTPLAHELALKPSRLTGLFHNLGCTIKPVTVAQAAELGLSKSEATSFKVAILSAPVQLPDMTRRRRG